MGSSVKKDSTSAGLFGIGKGAPFAVSDLRMVFYNTVVEGRNRSIGVMKFVSFKEGDKITQGTGYSGKNGSKKPVEKMLLLTMMFVKKGELIFMLWG